MRSKDWLRSRVAFYRRNLKAAKLATEAEIANVASRFPGDGKDDLWEELAHLMSLARRREWRGSQGSQSRADALDIALYAMADKPITVELPSARRGVKVHPASWPRILLIEDQDFWLQQLHVLREVIRSNYADYDEPQRMLQEVAEEIDTVRLELLAQVIAPGPAIYEGRPPEWLVRLTPIEDMALKQAWHRLNLEPLLTMPKPVSKKGDRELPSHWAFLFESVSWRTKQASPEVVHNRSLVSMVAESSVRAIQESGKMKQEARSA